VRRLGVVVLTHAHPDHRRGLLSVARNFRIREFWQGAPGPPDAEAEALDRELRRAARWTLAAGAERRLGEVKLEVLWPEAGPGPPKRDENDRSLTLRLIYGRTAFLFPGDIGTGIEARLADSGRDLRADLLKAAHHGSRTSSSDGFLAAVDPELIVITCGRANSYGLPHPDVMARLEGTGARVLRTDRDGAVEIRSDGRRIAVRSARSAGRERRPD
jgi:competence protein ComEC